MINIAQSMHNKYVEQNYYNDPVLQGVFELHSSNKKDCLFISYLMEKKSEYEYRMDTLGIEPNTSRKFYN